MPLFVVGGQTSRSLVIDNESVLSTNIPDLLTHWFSPDTVALSTRPSGFAPGILYFLNLNNGRVSRVIGSTFGLTSLVSPDKSWVVFSRTNSNGGSLSIRVRDLKNNNEKVLAINTLPERCVFSQDTRFIFCSTFNSSPSAFIMPDDYYKGVFVVGSSGIARVNLETGEVKILESFLPVDATSLRLSDNEDKLFFIDRSSNNIFSYEIK